MALILLNCEESGAVCEEFRKLGHEAYSCDILPTSGNHPEWHLQMDALEAIKLKKWDLMIAFPPCTHLAVSGAKHFAKKRADGRQQEGIDFFMEMVNAPIPHIAIENPVGIMSTLYRKPDQIINPWQFGDEFQKKTCLWLKGLPKLVPTKIVGKGEIVTFKSGKRMAKWFAVSAGDGSTRSKTFKGIAEAFAKQYSEYLKSIGIE